MIMNSCSEPAPPPHSAPNGPPDDGLPGACVEVPVAGGAADGGGGAAEGGAADGGAADGGGGAAWSKNVEIMGWACTARGPFRQLNLGFWPGSGRGATHEVTEFRRATASAAKAA